VPELHRILVADDYPDTAETTADLLRLDGYEVFTAFNGQQAVQAANEQHPEVIILDINMPVMDGYQAAAELRLHPPSDPRPVLVAHTARATPADVKQAMDSGFDHHVGKPGWPRLADLLRDLFEERAR
jgi:CheY-like chemotaxis protein